jgi:hypothetical protein
MTALTSSAGAASLNYISPSLSQQSIIIVYWAVNANAVLLFTTIPPSKDSEYLTTSAFAARLEGIKNLCAISYDATLFRPAMGGLEGEDSEGFHTACFFSFYDSKPATCYCGGGAAYCLESTNRQVKRVLHLP